MVRKVYSSNGVTVEFNDNVEGVLDALQNAVNRGLEIVGEKAENYAKDKAPRATGNLRDHITHIVEENEVYVGVSHMNPPYGIYVEFGTGIYAEGGGRPTPWVYQDDEGKWHYTHGQAPQPFIRPAATEHTDEYREILINSLRNA